MSPDVVSIPLFLVALVLLKLWQALTGSYPWDASVVLICLTGKCYLVAWFCVQRHHRWVSSSSLVVVSLFSPHLTTLVSAHCNDFRAQVSRATLLTNVLVLDVLLTCVFLFVNTWSAWYYLGRWSAILMGTVCMGVAELVVISEPSSPSRVDVPGRTTQLWSSSVTARDTSDMRQRDSILPMKFSSSHESSPTGSDEDRLWL